MIVHVNPIISQLSYGIEQANTYLIIENKHTVVIDACSARVVEEIINRKLIPDYVLLTHEHVDHLWGLNALRDMFPDIKVIAQKHCSTAIQDSKSNKAAQYRIYAVLRFGEEYKNKEAENRKYRCARVEVEFDDSYELRWEGHQIRIIHSPGHSSGSSMVFMEDLVFSGDTLLNEETFLKFDGGDAQLFSTVTVPLVKKMKDKTIIFPGHGKIFLKKEWKNTYE